MCYPRIPEHRRQHRLSMALTLLIVLASWACSDTAPSPSVDPYVGVWTGALTDDTAGPGSFTMTLAGAAVLSGTWTASLTGLSQSGTLTADPSGGTSRSFAMSCGAAPAQGSLLLVTTVSGGTASGTYRSFLCEGLVAGSVNLTRR